MNTLRITGAEPEILKVHHTRYLVEVLHMRLRDAKHVTDDILAGRARDVEVPAELADLHAATLRILGARVEILPERRAGAA